MLTIKKIKNPLRKGFFKFPKKLFVFLVRKAFLNSFPSDTLGNFEQTTCRQH